MRKSFLYTFLLSFLIPCTSGSALTVDLTTKELYVRKGFSTDWIKTIQTADPWKKIKASDSGRRSVKIVDIDPEFNSRRPFLSFKKYNPETYTFITSFSVSRSELAANIMPAVYLAQIGINWEIYLNGNLVKSEMHIGKNNIISISKNMRDLIAYIPPGFLREGENILAFRITGDPAYKETGLYWNGRYLIDDYEKLKKTNSETIPIVLIFLYLFIGAYHLFLYSKRTTERYNLYYGIFSMMLFIYILSRTHSVYSIISDTEIITRIEVVSLFMLLPLFSSFINQITTNRISRVTRYYSFFCIAIACIALIAPLPAIIDMLLVWQISAIFLIIPYIVLFALGRPFIDEVKKTSRLQENISKPEALIAIKTLGSSVPGNLIIGTTVAALCGIYDIMDALYFSSGEALLKYGFLFIVAGITIILANRFQNLFKQVEDLNFSLKKNIEDLNDANRAIAVSEEKYRRLVEGSQDIIFSLDENWRFITANRAMKNILRIDPASLRNSAFLDIVHESEESKSVSKQLVREQLEKLISTRKPVQFRLHLKAEFYSEPKEMLARLEYINTGGKTELFGKITNPVEDPAFKYFNSEKIDLTIGNHLTSAEEVSQRITENLIKYTDVRQINLIRLALREVIINSIEHGNLGITFSEKSDAMAHDNYFNFISERQNHPDHKDKKVYISYSLDAEKVEYTISDEGTGFDFENALEGSNAKTANSEMLAHGRGLAMAKNTFDKTSFSNKGTMAVLTKYFNKNKGPENDKTR